MEILSENYVIIIIVGAFLIFALIGYLIDMLRNNTKEEDKYQYNIKPIEINDIKVDEEETKIEEEIPDKKENNPDELLENYENSE